MTESKSESDTKKNGKQKSESGKYKKVKVVNNLIKNKSKSVNK